MKKVYFAVCAMAVMLSGCLTLDVAVSNKFDPSRNMKKIAVFPFTMDNGTWGAEFADSVSHEFFKSGIEIVEREDLDKILREDKLSASGVINDTSAAAIGRKLGADAIVLGRGAAGNRLKGMDFVRSFSLRVIDVETASHLITVRMPEGNPMTYDYVAKKMVEKVLNTFRTKGGPASGK